MKIPAPIENLIENFERLPGIGPKTAQRLVFHLLRFPQEDLEKFADTLIKLKQNTIMCSICKNIGETDPCWICSDAQRTEQLIAVVSNPMDIFALERAGYKGKYHVLHGIIDPLNNIGPDELYINSLLSRLKSLNDYYPVEVILSTNTSMEGESTALYISRLIKDQGMSGSEVKVTRLARGLPSGGDVEYADSTTLMRALEGRSNI